MDGFDCDVLVIGSGAGGLSAAVTAAAEGLSVVVVEKEAVYGGTTAWSGGWLWIPRNPLAVEAGIVEPEGGPREYLRHELGDGLDPARVEAFLQHGPRMVEFFRTRTAVQFVDGNAVPDFHGTSPGAREGGRSLCAAPFDARELGVHLAGLRRPLDLISPWGMGIASGEDLRHFLNAARSWVSFRYVTGRVLRHVGDLLRHGRGMRLVNGNALAARLARSAFDLGVDLRLEHRVLRLLRDGERVTGALVTGPNGRHELKARCGVVLACGGFPHDAERRRALLPRGDEHRSAAPVSNTGDGLRLGEAVGGVVDAGMPACAGFAPVSLVPRADGSTGAFPHLLERAKPGVIAVLRSGRRFVNEAGSYHDVGAALLAAAVPGAPAEAWLVCDHRFIRRYGLGHAKPAPVPLFPSLRSGYLKRGRTLAALAVACGIDPTGLAATVDACNEAARDGRDPEFGRGSTAYNRAGGDASHGGPNPCVAPIERGPFYAVRLVPGSLGTFAGLRTDASARVLDAQGEPVPGLFACGADMVNVMAGRYPSGGITLGPAMTFGWLIGQRLARERAAQAAETTTA